MKKSNPLQLNLLRHGETILNESSTNSIFLGSTDVPLSELGWQQMHAAIKTENYQRVISSPLKRCADFSKKLASNNNIALVIEDDLREINFGDWEAKTIKNIWAKQEKLLSQFWHDPLKNTPPKGETLIDFQYRVSAAFEKIINEYKDEKILMVVHGGVIRQLIANVMCVPFKSTLPITIDYASLTRLDCYAESIKLSFINQQVSK